MRIPLSYNLRNLIVRKTTTLMTALGIALTVSVLIAVLALVSGLRHAFDTSAHPLNVLVVRNGAQSELNSNFSRTQFQDLKNNSAIARSGTGEPLASLEMVTVIVIETPGKESGTNINLRGVLPAGLELREGLRLEQGRWFAPGRRECVIGRALLGRNSDLRVGGTLQFGRGSWQIVGVMSHGKSAVNSEVWVDVNQVSADYNRSSVVSSALLRAVDEAGVKTLIESLESDRRLNVDAVTEKEYYDRQTVAGLPVQFIGTLVAFIMAIGS
jgi:putative ABC transport system permease protein